MMFQFQQIVVHFILATCVAGTTTLMNATVRFFSIETFFV